MRISILLVLAVFSTSAALAQNNPTYAWMENVAKGGNDQYITSFDDDNDGNLYSGGIIRNFASDNYTHFNNGDSILFPGAMDGFRGFLMKADSNGVAQWTKDFTQGSQSGVRKVVVSPAQELYVASYTEQPLTLDGISIPTRAIYLFKYDLNGVLQSHVEFVVDDTFYSVDNLAIDEEGNAYISGFFNGTIVFGAYTISSGDGGIFHVKIDATGEVSWVQQFSGRTWDMKIAHDGNILIAGNCPSSAQFGSFTGGSTGYQNPFIVKLDASDGTPLFLHTPACFNGGETRTIIEDEDDNIYIGGFFGLGSGPTANSNLDFGMFSILPIGGNETTGFIAKYSSTGDPIWAKTMGGDGNGQAHKMTIHNNTITVRGEMDDACLFPNESDSILIKTFNNAPYFATMTTDGLWLSARATSFLHGHIFDFLQTNTGSIYFAGQFAETYEYNDGQDSIVSLGNFDAVIAKLNDISTVTVNAPSNLQVIGHGTNNWNATTILSWNDNSNDEYGFFLYALDQNGAPFGANTTVANITNGSVDWLWSGVTYDFYVYSHKYDMLSASSNVVTDVAEMGSGVGVNEELGIEFSFYPNPSEGVVYVNTDVEIQQIEILDLIGNQVFNKVINGTQDQIHLEHLPKGIYLVNVYINEGLITKKLILK